MTDADLSISLHTKYAHLPRAEHDPSKGPSHSLSTDDLDPLTGKRFVLYWQDLGEMMVMVR